MRPAKLHRTDDGKIRDTGRRDGYSAIRDSAGLVRGTGLRDDGEAIGTTAIHRFWKGKTHRAGTVDRNLFAVAVTQCQA